MTNTVDGAFASLQGVKFDDLFRRELPPDLIEPIERLIGAFTSADTKEREEIVARAERSRSFIFESYASRAARESIRRNEPDLLKRGLIALAIENGKFDWRDTLPYLALLYRSACKLNMDGAGLFHETAQIACPPFRGMLERFVDSDEGPRTIESYHYKEMGEGDTFAYVYVQPPYRRRSETELKLDGFFRRLRNTLPGIFSR